MTTNAQKKQTKKEQAQATTTTNNGYFIDVTFTEHAPVNKVLPTLIKLDKAEDYIHNYVKTYLELKLYKQFVDIGEKPDQTIELVIPKDCYINVVMTLQYISGVDSFNIIYSRVQKVTIFKILAKMKTPYGSYKEELEKRGLFFKEQTREEKQMLSSEQMEAIQEARTLLDGYGLRSVTVEDIGI